MAFVRAGSLGSVQSKVAGVTLALTTSGSDAYAGDLIVVAYATDNNNTSTIFGPFGDSQTQVADNAGNLYVQGAEGVNISGAHVSLYYSVLDYDLPSGSTITVTYISSKTARAITAERFIIDYPQVITVSRNLSRQNGDFAAISLSNLPQGEKLFLWAGATEGPLGDTYTGDANYTQFARNGTTGSTGDTNMTIQAASRISYLVNDSHDAANTGRDYVQVYIALQEYYTEPPDTPGGSNLPLVDNFDRANQTPLSGNWTTAFSNGVNLSSNQLVNPGNGLNGGSYYNTTDYGNNLVAATKIIQKGADITQPRWGGVFAHITTTGASWNGYMCLMIGANSADSFNTRLGLYRASGGTYNSSILGMARASTGNNDYVCIRSAGDYIEGWYWNATVAKWQLIGVAKDTTLRSGEAGVTIRQTTGTPTTAYVLDNFYAASYTVAKFVPRIDVTMGG